MGKTLNLQEFFETLDKINELNRLYSDNPEFPMKVGDKLIETQEELNKIANKKFNEYILGKSD